jgi:hypothetical protein
MKMALDPVTLTFAATMIASPPQPAVKPRKKAAVVKTSVVQQDERFGDFAKAVLKCYHGTARYVGAAIDKRPWAEQAKYGANTSALITIDYLGLSNASYTMTVGVLAKPGAVKTVITIDTAKIHAYEQCELGDWVAVK